MPAFTIARNDASTYYEIHAEGCRHLTTNPRLEPMVTATCAPGTPAAAVAATYEDANEGCLAKIAPCATKGT